MSTHGHGHVRVVTPCPVCRERELEPGAVLCEACVQVHRVVLSECASCHYLTPTAELNSDEWCALCVASLEHADRDYTPADRMPNTRGEDLLQ